MAGSLAFILVLCGVGLLASFVLIVLGRNKDRTDGMRIAAALLFSISAVSLALVLLGPGVLD